MIWEQIDRHHSSVLVALQQKGLNLSKDTLVRLIGDSKVAVGVLVNGYLSLCANLLKNWWQGVPARECLAKGKGVFTRRIHEIHWIAQKQIGTRWITNVWTQLYASQCYQGGRRVIPRPAQYPADETVIRPLEQSVIYVI